MLFAAAYCNTIRPAIARLFLGSAGGGIISGWDGSIDSENYADQACIQAINFN